MIKDKEKVAEIALESVEVAEALAFYLSQKRLSPSHVWNSYNVGFRIREGEILGVTVTYYLDAKGREKAVKDGILPRV